ncbi:MAG: DNA-binding protein [Acidimicrobiia bacterium]|nr:DNA-binding protein [Acidimicrobiia bacterium]
MERGRELGEFLRSRRARLQPGDLGVTSTGQRRTPGLRREELARLSGVGLTWYSRLEQGRASHVSPSVLGALARALRLDQAETSHLYALAGAKQPEVAPVMREPHGAEGSVARTLAALEPCPSFAMDRLWNIVAWNSAHQRALIDLSTVPPEERNLLRIVFCNPTVRALMADWKIEARILTSEYRADVAEHSSDTRHRALVAHLEATDPAFRRWWREQDVATFAPRPRQFHRPDGSILILEHQRLQLVAEPTIRIVTYLPAPAALPAPSDTASG